MNEVNEASPANKVSDVERVVMCQEWFKQSEYRADFIPEVGTVLIGVDRAKDGSGCTVKGFYKDGEYHVQSVEYRGT
jgi:hypothetical protein